MFNLYTVLILGMLPLPSRGRGRGWGGRGVEGGWGGAGVGRAVMSSLLKIGEKNSVPRNVKTNLEFLNWSLAESKKKVHSFVELGVKLQLIL